MGNEDKDPGEKDLQEEDPEAIDDLEVGGEEAENVRGGTTRNPDLGGHLA